LPAELVKASAAAGLALLLLGASARAAPEGPPPPGGWDPLNGVTFGPAAAWVGGGPLGNAFATGFELTYFQLIHTPLSIWASAGARLWTDGDQTPVLPYGEIGLSFAILVLGAGYTAGLNSDDVPDHGVHGFFGLAIPIWIPARGHFLYVEPYYRPTWDVTGEGRDTSHELGAMLKWFIAIGFEQDR
jgi:hypothetical protein